MAAAQGDGSGHHTGVVQDDGPIGTSSNATHSVQIFDKTFKLLNEKRKEGESDDALMRRALKALDTLSIVSRALATCSDFRKAAVVTRQLRAANYEEDMTIAICRALFGDQSEKDMKKAFKFFDKDGGGTLSRAELEDALPLMGENVPQARIAELFQLVDADGGGNLCFDEFVTLVKGMNPKGEADGAFAAFQGFSTGIGDLQNEVGATLFNAKDAAGGTFSALSTAWNSELSGLSPFEMRKAGVMLDNMKKAGYSDAMANTVVSAVLCDQSEKNIRKAFDFFDDDGSGHLDLDEVKAALPLMGEDVPPKVIKDLIKKVDSDKSGKISFNEFVVLTRGMNPKDGESSSLTSSLMGSFGW
eukprot:TRINITY_DN70830_c0_g1_i1.p1 TRINITY_DN70830_c0_g1~~TRINITY_DN70830_c0_g1_i1.p1  ORF type:complete len:359 (+),score=82.53 TRINITY_DN70830_c0_g1_i1:69-1145(+)